MRRSKRCVKCHATKTLARRNVTDAGRLAIARNHARSRDRTATTIEIQALRLLTLLGIPVTTEVKIGSLQVDFVHEETKTAIEVNGWHHRMPGKLQADEARSKRLEALGYRVVVLWWDQMESWALTLQATFKLSAWRQPEVPTSMT